MHQWGGAHYDHYAYWIDAIRNGGKVIQDPVFGFVQHHQHCFVTIVTIKLNLLTGIQ